MTVDKHRFSGNKISVCICVYLWAFFIAQSVLAEETPRSAMRKGLQAYRKGDYTNAVVLLEKAALEFPEMANYNLGNAQYRLGEFEKAAEYYNDALRTTDLNLQQQAYFNRGNALLACTTRLPDKEQLGRAIEYAFQAMDMYEKAILLDPEDIDAKQNFERAQKLRLDLERNLGRWYFNDAEAELSQFKAGNAQALYRKARKQFEHILENVNPNDSDSRLYLPQVNARLEMLRQAVDDAEDDLQTALKQIDEYQYALAAARLTKETDQRKYAFDIKPDLKNKYDETIQKNQEVLQIIQDLSDLNIVK